MNDKVAAGVKLGNDESDAGYEAVKDIPAKFQNEFGESKSWVQQIGTMTNTSASLDSSMIINFPTITVDSSALSAPSASSPAFAPGELMPYMSGGTTGPYYYIYGSTGQASYNSSAGTGSASGSFTQTGLPTPGVSKETLTAWANYTTGNTATGATLTVYASYEKLMENQDRDAWSVNMSFNNGQWSGFVSAASKHGVVSASGNAAFSNGQLAAATFSGTIDGTNRTLNVSYSKMRQQDGTYHITSGASYRDTLFESITAMADFSYASDKGSRATAGVGYRYDNKAYIEAIFASYSPLVGPPTTAGKITGSIPLANNLLTLQTSISITNQNVTNNSVNVLTSDIPSYTPFTFRAIFIDDYQHFKDDWFAGVGWIIAQ